MRLIDDAGGNATIVHLAEIGTRELMGLRLEYFPAYAPELNPDEGVWRQTKSQLANGRPDDLDALQHTLIASLTQLRRSSPRLRACIAHAELPVRLP